MAEAKQRPIDGRTRRLWVVASAASLLSCAWAHAAPTKLARPAERAWLERSAALIQAAKGNANVADFRRDVQAHRERLREIVRSSKNNPPALVQLQRTMIVTNALLNAASECHSGGRVVCPADLMQQLEERVRAGFAQLNAIEGGAA